RAPQCRRNELPLKSVRTGHGIEASSGGFVGLEADETRAFRRKRTPPRIAIDPARAAIHDQKLVFPRQQVDQSGEQNEGLPVSVSHRIDCLRAPAALPESVQSPACGLELEGCSGKLAA